MTPEDILELASEWDDILIVTPQPGDGSPELAWGDAFLYFEPSGVMPTNRQPFATIVTKNYPDDSDSALDRDGVYRVNIHPGRDALARVAAELGSDPSELDRVIPHPVYGTAGWLAVLNPGERASALTVELLRDAYEQDRRRVERRLGTLDS
jgi:hypothetical protein